MDGGSLNDGWRNWCIITAYGYSYLHEAGYGYLWTRERIWFVWSENANLHDFSEEIISIMKNKDIIAWMLQNLWIAFWGDILLEWTRSRLMSAAHAASALTLDEPRLCTLDNDDNDHGEQHLGGSQTWERALGKNCTKRTMTQSRVQYSWSLECRVADRAPFQAKEFIATDSCRWPAYKLEIWVTG